MKRPGIRAIVLGLLALSAIARADAGASPMQQAGPVQAEYRGCESAGWCRFLAEPARGAQPSLLRIRPAGVAPMHGNDPVSIGVRDRLNALLASMIHQHKRIALHDLQALPDGSFEASVTVNEADVAADRILLELDEQRRGAH